MVMEDQTFALYCRIVDAMEGIEQQMLDCRGKTGVCAQPRRTRLWLELPEPASIGLIALGGLVLLRRRAA